MMVIFINSSHRINIAGMGIGDGWMSPFHNAQYGNFLYQVGLVDEKQRDQCLDMEAETQSLIEQGNLYDIEYLHSSYICRLLFSVTMPGFPGTLNSLSS